MTLTLTSVVAFLLLLGVVFASPYHHQPAPNPRSTSCTKSSTVPTCAKPSTVTITSKKTCTVYIPKTTVTKWQKKTITVTDRLTETKVVSSFSVSGSVATESLTATVTESFTEGFTASVTESFTNSVTESFTESVTATESFTESVTATESFTESVTATESFTESVTASVTESFTESITTTEVSITTEVSVSIETSIVTETYTPTCNPQVTPYLSDNSFATSTQADGFYSFWTVAKATLAAPDAFQTGGPGSNNVFQYVGTHPNGYGANLDFTSLQVIVFGNQIVKVTQKIRLCAGQRYKLSGYWNYAGGSDACSAEICFDGESCGSGGRYSGASNFPRQPATDRYGWLPYSGTFSPTVSGDVEVQFKFKCEGTAVNNGNRLYLDHTTFTLLN